MRKILCLPFLVAMILAHSSCGDDNPAEPGLLPDFVGNWEYTGLDTCLTCDPSDFFRHTPLGSLWTFVFYPNNTWDHCRQGGSPDENPRCYTGSGDTLFLGGFPATSCDTTIMWVTTDNWNSAFYEQAIFPSQNIVRYFFEKIEPGDVPCSFN